MSKYRRAAKIDAAQPGIVKALKAIPGVTVQTGMDDILCGRNGKTFWFEIKTPKNKKGTIPESAKKESQKKLEKEWAGHYKIVSTLNEILTEIGL